MQRRGRPIDQVFLLADDLAVVVRNAGRHRDCVASTAAPMADVETLRRVAFSSGQALTDAQP